MRTSAGSDRELIPVIISGGSGTRLWPLSRDSHPKQFLPIVGETSLYQQTLLRARQLDLPARAPIVVCNAAHHDLVLAQARALGIELECVVLEPVGRNTAPAVAVAALLATRRVDAAADPLLLVMPADHVITDPRAFAIAVRTAVAAAEAGRLVTFGVVPDRPDTAYGYIRRAARHGAWAEIAQFVEKPNLEKAKEYVASGEYFWNSGMFLFTAGQVLAEMRKHAPAILTVCERVVAAATADGVVARLGGEFTECPANSLDYAVMEKTTRGAVVPLAAGWSDVGSWPSLHDALPHDAQGNSASGEVLLESCSNTYIYASSRIVAAVGLEGIVVVETEDAVLVLQRDRAQDVRNIVDALRAQRRNST
jgi:mannose-1-phosphate guanylyltransferase/mannose-6-phosphate isomerase